MASIELTSKIPKSNLYFNFIKEAWNQPDSYTGNKFANNFFFFSDNTRETIRLLSVNNQPFELLVFSPQPQALPWPAVF